MTTPTQPSSKIKKTPPTVAPKPKERLMRVLSYPLLDKDGIAALLSREDASIAQQIYLFTLYLQLLMHLKNRIIHFFELFG